LWIIHQEHSLEELVGLAVQEVQAVQAEPEVQAVQAVQAALVVQAEPEVQAALEAVVVAAVDHSLPLVRV
jgi:hypothetical protein